MPVIALQGIRGGVGVTSIAAGLAWALQQLNESVLVIDFTSDNLLRLHFNMPFLQIHGWARSYHDQQNWLTAVHAYNSLLSYLPFGKITLTERIELEKELKKDPNFWNDKIDQLILEEDYQWILLDLPADATLLAQQGLAVSDTEIILLTPDINSYVRLHQQMTPDTCYFLMNYYSPAKSLHKDLYDLWRQLLPNFLSITVHSDESMSEALAAKKPVGEYDAYSIATQDANKLAHWCISHCLGNRE